MESSKCSELEEKIKKLEDENKNLKSHLDQTKKLNDCLKKALNEFHTYKKNLIKQIENAEEKIELLQQDISIKNLQIENFDEMLKEMQDERVNMFMEILKM